MYHVFPDHRAGHAEQCHVAYRERYTFNTGGTDLRHERVPCAEGQAGVRGDEAQSRDGLSGRQGVFRQQTGRIGGYGRDRGLRDVCRPGNVQHEEGGSEFLPRTAGTHVQRGRPCHRHAADVLPDCAFDAGTDFVRPVLLGRFPGLAQPMVRPLYQHLPVAPGE